MSKKPDIFNEIATDALAQGSPSWLDWRAGLSDEAVSKIQTAAVRRAREVLPCACSAGAKAPPSNHEDGCPRTHGWDVADRIAELEAARYRHAEALDARGVFDVAVLWSRQGGDAVIDDLEDLYLDWENVTAWSPGDAAVNVVNATRQSEDDRDDERWVLFISGRDVPVAVRDQAGHVELFLITVERSDQARISRRLVASAGGGAS